MHMPTYRPEFGLSVAGVGALTAIVARALGGPFEASAVLFVATNILPIVWSKAAPTHSRRKRVRYAPTDSPFMRLRRRPFP
jgi:hypothetical protein